MGAEFEVEYFDCWGEGYLYFFGVSVDGFEFDGGVCLVGEELVVDGEVGLSFEGHFHRVFSH